MGDKDQFNLHNMNTIAADGLAIKETRVLAGMVLT